MISGETPHNSYFKAGHQRCLQALSVLIRCRPQCFELKPQSFFKLPSLICKAPPSLVSLVLYT